MSTVQRGALQHGGMRSPEGTRSRDSIAKAWKFCFDQHLLHRTRTFAQRGGRQMEALAIDTENAGATSAITALSVAEAGRLIAEKKLSPV
jgi:hypothetical protein